MVPLVAGAASALSLPLPVGVALRITVDNDDTGVIVRVAGRLDGDGVPELERVVATLAGPIRLELADLRSADRAALDVLRALRARGIGLIHMSSYLGLLIEGRTGAPAKSRRLRSRKKERRKGD